MEGSQTQSPFGSAHRLASYGEGRGAGSSSRYGEALGKPWLEWACGRAPAASTYPGKIQGGQRAWVML